MAYSTAISACEQGGQWQSAIHPLSLMPEDKAVPSTVLTVQPSEPVDGGQWQSQLYNF